MKNKTKKQTELILFTILITLTLGLRLWQLDGVPPGWRDDELINSLVISQHALDGDIRPYYADASGHEGLYHILNAVFLGLFGPTPAGIRLLSVILGCVTIVFTYLLTVELFHLHEHKKAVGFLAATALSLSFWSLMYSRTGIRHISLPALVLPSFYFLFQWLNQVKEKPFQIKIDRNLVLAAITLGAAYYTYFASRGVPLILIAFVAYLALIDWSLLKRSWKQWLFFGVLSTLLAIPLYFSIQNQAGADARVAELAVPLIAMGEGNFEPLIEHVRLTLSMTHAAGDGEFLYNIPGRPLFGPIGAILFWVGIVICLYQSIISLWRRWIQKSADSQLHSLPYIFLFLWWLAGISPAFISVPPASLSHTILAQSAFYMIPIVPLIFLLDWIQRRDRTFNFQIGLIAAYGLILLVPIALRDLPDYFVTWPQRGQTRFLYRADIHELADAIAADQLTDFAIGGPLAGPWDKVAFEANLGSAAETVTPRWYNPERAAFLLPRVSIFGRPRTMTPWQQETFTPIGTGVGEFNSYRATLVPFSPDDEVCFSNELCLTPYLFGINKDGQLEVAIQVFVPGTALLPVVPLISNPPPPDVYAGPRLAIFVQLLDADGNFVSGDDGFWVDPETLEIGDIFQQRHILALPALSGDDTIAFGLYDPQSGQRILTIDGRDNVQIPVTLE